MLPNSKFFHVLLSLAVLSGSGLLTTAPLRATALQQAEPNAPSESVLAQRIFLPVVAATLAVEKTGEEIPAEIANADVNQIPEPSWEPEQPSDVAEAVGAYGCTWAEGPAGSYVCHRVIGRGLYVNYSKVTRQRYLENVCAHIAAVVVFTPSRGRYIFWSGWRRGCDAHLGWHYIPINRSFPHGSRICSYWYEDRHWVRGGVACHRILR